MTSNIGSAFLLDRENNEGDIDEDTKEKVLQQLRASFRPEFLNRIDDTILFKPLNMEDIKGIVTKLIEDLQKRLNDQYIRIEIEEEAKEWIATSAYDPVYGARPLKRFIQHQIETKLAREIIAGKVHPYDTLLIGIQNNDIFIKEMKQ